MTPMQYKISPSKDRTYIVQRIWGDIMPRAAVKCTEELLALGKSLGINLYFVDATEARNVGDVFETYEFAYHMIDPGKIDWDAVIALLVHSDDHSHDFFETVARNAGHNVRLFRDREQALKHLCNRTASVRSIDCTQPTQK